MRLARPGLLAARAAVPAEHQQPAAVVGHHVAERIDRERRQVGRRKRGRIVALAAAVERGAPLGRVVHAARTGIDDQAVAVGHVGVAARIAVRIAVLALRGVELVPARLLVRDIDLPLDVDQRAGIAAALDPVADLERPPFGRVVVIDEHLEPRGLPLDAPVGVAEIRDQHGRRCRPARTAGLPCASQACGSPAGVSGAM